MKILIINPKDQTITESTIEAPDILKQLQGVVGGYIEHVGSISTTGDAIYVDEEGRLKEETKNWFVINSSTNPQPLCGNCAIVGPDGESDATVTVEELKAAVQFLGEG